MVSFIAGHRDLQLACNQPRSQMGAWPVQQGGLCASGATANHIVLCWSPTLAYSGDGCRVQSI